MKNKILFVVCLLFGLMFINSGLNKLFNYMPMPKDLPEDFKKVMAALMEVKWLLPLVATAEIIGGILFIIKKTRPLGAIIVFPIMIGIVLTHIMYAQAGLSYALVLLAVNLWVIIENRRKYLPMVQ